MFRHQHIVPALMLLAGRASSVLAAGEEHGEPPSLFSGDLGNAFWTLLIFALLLVVLGRFAWKPILTALQKREEFIHDSLAQAKKDREEAEARLADYTTKLDKARREATAIVEEGRRDAEVVRRKIHDDANREGTDIIERAKKEIALARDSAVRELYKVSGSLATELAGKIIRKQLSADDHQQLIKESIDELAKKGGNDQ